MDLNAKRQIDYWVGSMFLLALSPFFLLARRLFPRGESGKSARRILVMKFQGMGSMVLARPGLRLLRREYPEATILFWGTPATCGLARLCPEIDEVIELEDRSLFSAFRSLWMTLPRFWSKRIDWAFDLEVYSKLSSFLLVLTFARNRVGFVVDSVWLRRNLLTHLVFFNRLTYLGEAYTRFFGVLSGNPSFVGDTLPLEWVASDAEGGEKYGRYAVVAIHCGPLALERRWPKESYARLFTLLLERDGSPKLILIGQGSFERRETAEFLEAIPSPNGF